MADKDKAQALETALNQIENTSARARVMRLGQNSTMNVEAIPTGSLALDIALGIGGVPKGRIIEIYGLESLGKHHRRPCNIVAEAQKMGGDAVFIDGEHARSGLCPGVEWTSIPRWFPAGHR